MIWLRFWFFLSFTSELTMSTLPSLLSGLPRIGVGTYRLRKDHPGHRAALSKVR